MHINRVNVELLSMEDDGFFKKMFVEIANCLSHLATEIASAISNIFLKKKKMYQFLNHQVSIERLEFVPFTGDCQIEEDGEPCEGDLRAMVSIEKLDDE